MMRAAALVEKVLSYDPDANEKLLNRAYVYTVKAHGSQTRASGDPYFSHPIEVAGILTNYKLDSDSIVTALLHDTIEDTVATYDDLERHFGTKIARLVDGVTKLSKLELQSDHTKQAENFRKLLLAMSDDIRVLLVKLADRLHNMRTLKFIRTSEKRRRIAAETMEIYAPLAERIGMNEIKDELEDLAFAQINDHAYRSIITRLEYLQESAGNLIDLVVEELQQTIAAAGIGAEVIGRGKRPYSIWRKMETKNVSFEQLSDVIAFRIIVEDVPTCYQVLGIVHEAYPMVPGLFKDYISTPKRNKYQSIHTTVIGPQRHRIEVQIRTDSMHQIAESGVAAHWRYKQSASDADKDGTQYQWLRELLEILENASDPDEFLEYTKLNMFQDQVFCFTPVGDLIALPSGATPIDFAYAVHTDLGNTCVGVKINGRVMPLRTRLQNGDQVDIVTAEDQTPSPTWENFVVTGKARSAIRRFSRQQRRAQFLELGKQILLATFTGEGYQFSEAVLETFVNQTEWESNEDVLVAVGRGLLDARDVLQAIYPGAKFKAALGKVVPLPRGRDRRGRGGRSVPIRGLIPGMAVHTAECCHPLPGERIVGIVVSGKGITIHTSDCETLEQFSATPERWIEVSWDVDGEDDPPEFVGRVATIVANTPGALSNLTRVIAQNDGNISNLRFTKRSKDVYEITIDIEVRNLQHLTNIITALRAEPLVSSAKRGYD